MSRHFHALAAVLGSALILASCGQPGAPQPPSLEMPRAVSDLSVTRKGDRVAMRWTPPLRFTDGRLIRHPGKTNICRTPGSTPLVKCTVVASIATKMGAPGSPRQQSEFQDKISQAAPGSVMYGVEVLNEYGRSVGLSNQVEISTAPALAPPGHIAARVGENGVTVSWQRVSAPALNDIRFAYQISRRGEAGGFGPIATVPIDEETYLDQTFEWEKEFEYRVEVVTQAAAENRVLVEGDDSETVKVLAHDVFPPAQPHEVQAVFSGPGQKAFIDLTWAPNLEPDLAGYNVFRREEGTQPVKLNEKLVSAPSFRDEHVEAGKRYFYTVTGVDVRGNESAPSVAASESVP